MKTVAEEEEQSQSPRFVTERRKTQRVACEGKGDVIVLGGALQFTGILRDLSVSGCLLETNKKFVLERGTQLEIILDVNRLQFRVAGGVRSNSSSRGVGFEFMHLSSRCAEQLRQLVDELKNQAALKEEVASAV
jgi:c-di-GMP-binding flagellar brake protein YcgR